MLKLINRVDDWVIEIIKEDPVRTNLSADFRINDSAEMYAWWEKDQLGAVCCVRYTNGIPVDISDMQDKRVGLQDTAVFYTVWSYAKGSGSKLINEASEEIKLCKPAIKNLVTLSPKTEMAERFHIRNGAIRYRENEDSINYAYQLENNLIN